MATFVDAALAVDGTYAYQVSAVSAEDYEGPKSTSLSVVYDTTAPVVGPPALSLNPRRTTETSILSASVTDAGSGVAGGEYFVGVNDPGPGHGTSMIVGASTLTATIGTTLAAGTYKLNVRARDTLGTWSAPRPIELTVSRPAPPTGLFINTPVNDDPVLSWSASADAVAYAIFRDDVRLAAQPTDTGYTDVGRPDGSYRYTVRAVNALGDESDPAGSATVLVDRTRPIVEEPTWTVNPIDVGTSTTLTAGVSDPVPPRAASWPANTFSTAGQRFP
jgi:predicted phage tail protein